MDIRLDSLESGYFFHIYNRGINGCKVFENDDNRFFFLKKAKQYLLPVAEVYAYCLMPNHFHFLLYIKDDLDGFAKEQVQIQDSFAKVLNFGKAPNCEAPKFRKTSTKIKQAEHGLHSEKSIASKQIGKLISSYTQAYNKYHNRHGALFERPFKRKRIQTEEYLRQSIVYIHKNVLELGINMDSYDFSSYKSLVSDMKTAVSKDKVIELFGGKSNFKYVHQAESSYEF